jgi:PTH1 family peptidyl-tRNA hydrolase
MGLFERKTTPITTPLYSVGNQRTKLVVGLGNIGPEYGLTRHNAGFLCLDYLVREQGENWKDKKDLRCHLAEIRLGDKRVLCMKPTTFMNLSGDAVQAVTHFYKIAEQDILVVHDELDLPFGSLRLRRGGSSAGHNGIKSVSAAIGEDYARLRIGIQNDHTAKMDAADFVLKPFSKAEQGSLPAMQTEVAGLITEFVFSDNLLPDTRQFI